MQWQFEVFVILSVWGVTLRALMYLQGLLKKHEVFETDFQIHKERCEEIKNEGEKRINEVPQHRTDDCIS